MAISPLCVIVLITVIGPRFVPHDPVRVVGRPSQPPGGDHLFGTDSAGLDVFSRTISAAQTNFAIAGTAAIGAALAGCVLGLVIGMNEARRGVVGPMARASARVIDLFESIPAVVVALAVVSYYGASQTSLVAAITVVLTPTQARLVRTEVLKVRTEAYLDAARMAGLSEPALTVRHVLPNSSWPALEHGPVTFGIAIILTAALGFLGVGLPPPTPEWGSMVARGASDAAVGRWWSALFPALAMLATVGSVSLAARALFRRR